MNPEFLLESFSYAVLSWSSLSDSACVATNYIVTLTNITEGNVAFVYNTTSITVFDLTQGAEYSFTVARVDTGDKVGEKSVSSSVLMFDSECSCKIIIFMHMKMYIFVSPII